MVVIAVPGGTGGVGRTIMDALRDSGKHTAIALSRKAPKTQDPINPILAVDYNDVDALTKVLEDNNVEVVISAIFIFDETSSATEINVVKAAEKSKTTTRFIISNWGLPTPPEELRLSPQKARLAVIAAISQTTLEWTQFYNGFFLDYYGMPYIQSYLNPVTFVVDVANKTAVIPGTGDEPVSLTYTRDLGKFVVAVLGLKEWEREYCCRSETTTWNKVVKRAEEIVGVKFKITYDDVDMLKRGESTEMPAYPSESYIPKAAIRVLQAMFGLYSVYGLFHVPEEKALNGKFPEIETITVDEVLDHWKGK
ncbi:NAD(P)-binding protein [Lentithecium fluviatile CBS 122367]|uniref:NAD(P)-binding protein n=1 Tax=Lentithecium fluviatile CBS 122367 TaxID=1168545 RepID=A0A6G1IJU5_9PLEO|nr:NAD(P)-binding protein [Lentithecium fluviatile CBS 122367]